MALSGRELKEAALIGFRHRREQIAEQILQLEHELGGRDAKGRDTTTSTPVRKKRVLSAAARKRIAAAQRKRWAAVKAAKETPATAQMRAPKKAAAKKRTAPLRARAAGAGSVS